VDRQNEDSRTTVRRLAVVAAQAFLFSHLLYQILSPADLYALDSKPYRFRDRSDFMDIFEPGIPRSVKMEWDLPSGISLGISGGHRLQEVEEEAAYRGFPTRMDVFPVSFLMKVPLYQTARISQSLGFGVGPCFLHQGKMPIEFSNFEVLGMSTCLTEWVSRISKDLYLNLRMKYTQAFQTMENRLPSQDFSTFLGLNARW